MAVKQGGVIKYAFIGDCRMLVLSQEAEIDWQSLTESTDRVSQAQAAFAPLRKNLPAKDDPTYEDQRRQYIRTVHTQFRNNPDAEDGPNPHPTYGVLTGQPEAVDERYIYTGEIVLSTGKTLVLSSDGLEPFMAQNDFREILVRGDSQEVEHYINAHPEIDTANDDKTLLVIR